jgi:hypothetical protein
MTGASHAISLCDMHAKYADVMKVGNVLAYFDTIPAGQFESPTGREQHSVTRKLAAEWVRTTTRSVAPLPWRFSDEDIGGGPVVMVGLGPTIHGLRMLLCARRGCRPYGHQ